MNHNGEEDQGVAQLYLPAGDLAESAQWYAQLGFYLQSETPQFVVLKNKVGPPIMLRKTESRSLVQFELGDREFPVVSIMQSDVEGLHRKLLGNSKEIGPVKRFGDNGKYVHFHVRDPYGNLLDIGNYPDR